MPFHELFSHIVNGTDYALLHALLSHIVNGVECLVAFHSHKVSNVERNYHTLQDMLS